MPSESQLSDVLSEFARTMITDFPIQGILDRLVERIVDVLPVTGAGVTLIPPAGNQPRFIAASDGAAMRFEQLQSELNEGPCLAAFRSAEPVSVPDLATDLRFPRFASRASAAGLAAVFTFPLGHSGAHIGALDLYRDTPGPLSEEDMGAARTLSDVAGAYLMNAQARAELVDAAHRFHHESMHDGLTGLPNRSLLIERLEHAVLNARRSRKLICVLYMDLDRFKSINDLHGHQAGDDLLVAFAHRLTAALRPGDTLARSAGDEFVVLCENLGASVEAEKIVARLNAALQTPFSVSGIEVTITASIGVTFAGEGYDVVPEEVLRNGDAAMYQAKRNGGAHHETLDVTERSQADHEASLASELGQALPGGELRLEYQPVVNAVDERIVGVEALARWDHPTRGAIPPAVFIPLAERTVLIDQIGRWVLERSCADLVEWGRHPSFSALQLSVNVSAQQIMDPSFARTVDRLLHKTSVDPNSLILEITETVFIRDGQRALSVLNDLKAIGVSLALDDFGTGFSSLSHLHRFPVDIVKIDKSFVAQLQGDDASQAIVSAVVHMAHMLGLSVVAEGVETVDQYKQLLQLGCDSCQGYYFSRPVPGVEVGALVSS